LAGHFARLGVSRGDRVLILLENSIPVLLASIAASRLGAIFVVLSPETKNYLLDHILADCSPSLVLSTEARISEYAFAPGLAVMNVEKDFAGALGAGPFLGDCPAVSVDPACLFYTSGTTNMPKAIISPHRQMGFALNAIQQRLEYRSGDVIGSFLPLSFDYGFYQFLLAANVGATLAVGSPLESVTGVLHRLLEWGVTVFPAAPNLTYALIQLGSRRRDKLPPLRAITNTGSHLPAAYIESLRELLPQARVYVMFGLTECKRVSIMLPDELDRKPNSVGRPLDDTECLIVGDDGAVLPPGEIGELVVRGPHVMPGYWRAPEETAKRFKVWGNGTEIALFSGDRASLDADGFLYFHGRGDDIFKQRGYRVSAAEIEAAALNVAGITQAAVLKPTERRGAVLVAVGDISVDALLEALRQRLEDYRIPETVIVRESLAFTGRGKIDKKALAAEFDQEAQP
jgi:acyl-CoA synthetase (AMP-forming)/AMP-acid ligase II